MAGIDRRARILKASTSAADGHASVAVADTGVGIEPASEPHLFDALWITIFADGIPLRRHGAAAGAIRVSGA